MLELLGSDTGSTRGKVHPTPDSFTKTAEVRYLHLFQEHPLSTQGCGECDARGSNAVSFASLQRVGTQQRRSWKLNQSDGILHQAICVHS
jgi:hypothetical protein